MEDRRKVILADDHKILSQGLKQMINNTNRFEVVAEVSDGDELLKLVDLFSPQVVVTDINMEKMSGLEAAEQIKKNHPDVKIVVLSMYEHEEYISKAYELGVDAYLNKNCERGELLQALEDVLKGEQYFGQSISRKIISTYFNKDKKSSHLQELTKREKEVLGLIVKGLKNKQIAEKLFLSPRTIDAHRYNIMQKLDVNNTAELVSLTYKEKLIDQ